VTTPVHRLPEHKRAANLEAQSQSRRTPEPTTTMGTLYISEYIDLLVIGGRAAPVVLEPAIAEQTVAIGGASKQSNPFQPTTRFVRLHSDSSCSVRFGADPTATNASGRLVAGQTEYRGVIGGLKLAVIANS